MFCGDNILVEKINKLIIYAFMSYSYECYEEVHSLLDGVLREGHFERRYLKSELKDQKEPG